MPKSPKTHGIAPEHIFSSVPQCPTTFFRFLRGEKCKMKQNFGRFTGFRFLLRCWQLAQKKNFFFSNFFGVQGRKKKKFFFFFSRRQGVKIVFPTEAPIEIWSARTPLDPRLDTRLSSSDEYRRVSHFIYIYTHMTGDAPPTYRTESSEWVFAAAHCSICSIYYLNCA